MSKANKIPDRWEDYGPFGDVIKGTNILPLKVPLKMKLISSLPEKERFTPVDLLDKLKDMDYKLGLIIDLTATRRYYDPDEFIERDVQYVKIFTQGHVVPSTDVIDQFTSAVSSFKEYNKDDDMIIGVHCTHGVNRTGYLICRYLIEQEDFKPEDAIKAFKEARGYPLERQNYIDDLLSLSGDRRECTQAKGSHGKHFQAKRKNDYNRTRNDYGHDRNNWRDPYHQNGGAQREPYRNTPQRKSRWGDPFQSREGSWRRDGGMNSEWTAWQGQGAYGGGWNDDGTWNGTYWGYDGAQYAQYNWNPCNNRTPQRAWNSGSTNTHGAWRNEKNTGYYY